MFICCLCCLCDAFWNVPCFIPFLFAFRSEVPTKYSVSVSLRLLSLFLISVMHCCCFDRCQSSTNCSVSVLHFDCFVVILPLFFIIIIYRYFLYILCFYICCNFLSSLVHFLNPDFSLNGLEKKNLAHFSVYIHKRSCRLKS